MADPQLIAGFDPADMTKYEKKGLDVLRADLSLSKWGLPFTIEQHSGKNVRAYRVGTLSPATTPLTEGTTPSVQNISGTNFSAALAWYGSVNTFSDALEAVGPSSFMEQNAQIFSIQGAETLEKLNYNEVSSGGTAFYANGTDSGSFDATSIFTSKDLRRINKIFGAKKVRGLESTKLYHLLMHDDNIFDIQTDDTVGSWSDFIKRDPDPDKWKGVVKVYGGVAVFRSQLVGTTSVNGLSPYLNVAVGYGAFACYDLKGMPFRLMLTPPDDINVANPLGLKGAVGWKCPYATDYIGSDGPRALGVIAMSSEPTA